MRRPQHQQPQEVTSREWLARQSSATGFVDAAGTGPSTDVVPSLLMQRSKRKTDGARFPRERGTCHGPLLTHPRLAHARTRHQGPWEVTSWEWLTRQSSALWFSDAAGTDPSTDAVLVLNHGAVASGLARAHDLSGSENAEHIDNANRKKQLALIYAQ